jgi:hypothetical protein
LLPVKEKATLAKKRNERGQTDVGAEFRIDPKTHIYTEKHS